MEKKKKDSSKVFLSYTQMQKGVTQYILHSRHDKNDNILTSSVKSVIFGWPAGILV